MSKSTYYKVLVDGCSCHGGQYKYQLPIGDKPGRWTRRIEDPEICISGYHLTTAPDLWLTIGCSVYEAEGDGHCGDREDKLVFERVRLIRERPDLVPSWWHDVEVFVKETIPSIRWMRNHEVPLKSWKMFYTRSAARAAARDSSRGYAWGAEMSSSLAASWDVARGSARDGTRSSALSAARVAVLSSIWAEARTKQMDTSWHWARDAELSLQLAAALLVCQGLDIDPKHISNSEGAMEVWRRGYGLYGCFDGTYYVYRRV